MGYTHYWDRPKEIDQNTFDHIRYDIAKVLPRISNVTDRLEVRLSKNLITLNGIEDAGHQTFVLDRVNSGWNFCKTARQPYDIAVCCALIIASLHCKDFTVSSDGDFEDEGWYIAREITPFIVSPGNKKMMDVDFIGPAGEEKLTFFDPKGE